MFQSVFGFLFLRISELPEPSLSWNKFEMLAFLHKQCRFSETVLTAMLRIQNKIRKKQKQNVSFQIYRYTCVSIFVQVLEPYSLTL